MAFDMGFDFRSTGAYVTDPAYGVPVLGEAYPHTYTNGNGKSINAGWADGFRDKSDISTTVDVRLAGLNNVYTDTNGGIGDFQVDLSSGSAPGAGLYTIDTALGAATGSQSVADLVTIKDNASVVLTVIPSHTVTDIGHFVDASGADRVPGAGSWDAVRQTVSVAFSTMTVVYHLENTSSSGTATQLAHFRLTFVSIVNLLMPQGVF